MTALVRTAAARGVVGEVRPSELLAAFESLAPNLAGLSLDCFDTILFRRVEQPVDVFFDLARSPAFRELGFAAKLRVEGEHRARSLARARRGVFEVTLPEIYRGAFPDLSDRQVGELAREELEAEKRACYAFGPTVELMRAARARGLPVFIVSDTYLREPELRELLRSALPEDAFEAVTRVVCSSEHGRSKVDGLFKDVLKAVGKRPASLLHVGDHAVSDLEAASTAGLHALRLVHHAAAVNRVLSAQAMAACLLEPAVRSSRSLPKLFGGLLAENRDLERPESLLGYVGAGPVLYAFGRFLLDELAALERAGARPKALFLMRDAHLPERVCAELSGGTKAGARVAVSRFASYAASFRSAGDVERYLARSAGSGRLESMARQLLLPDPLAQSILGASAKSDDPLREFLRRVRDESVVRVIVERSQEYRQRLLRYLAKAADIQAGDTLVLIDLGYEGTAQRELGPVLESELGVTVTGRYLLASRVPGWERTRKGLFDASVCDDRVLATLVPYVALLEDICTSDDRSVVDYDADGNPVLADRVLRDEQYERIQPIQTECLRFVRDARAFFAGHRVPPDAESLRIAALAALAQLLFLPTEPELRYLEGFRLDMNLATQDSFELFDHGLGLEALRRRGAFFMQPGSKNLRTNFPIELRYAGIELALSFIALNRYSLAVGVDDVSLRTETVPLAILNGRDGTLTTAEARATHDGYFSVLIPVGRGGFSVGVLFGQRYAWVQIDSAEVLPTAGLYDPDRSTAPLDAANFSVLDGLRDAGGGLFECLTESALLMINPPRLPEGAGNHACRVVFRPIVART